MVKEAIEEYPRTKDASVSEEVLSRVNNMAAGIGVRLATNLSRQLLPYKKKVREGIQLYPSDATKCARQIAYKALDFPSEPISVATKLKFIIGDLIETAVLALIAAAVPVYGNNEDLEVKIGGKPRRGRSDGTVNIMGRKKNLEIKSMSAYGFKEFVANGPDDTWGYIGQANVYMRAKLEGGLIDEPGATVFVGANRDTGELHGHEVSYEPKYALLADQNFHHVETAIEQGKLPNRPFEAKPDGTLPLICSYCPMKYSCWTSPGQRVTFQEDGTPQYSKEPTQYLKTTMVPGKSGYRPVWKVVS